MFWRHPGIGLYIDTLAESATTAEYPQASFERFRLLQKENLEERRALIAQVSDEFKSLKVDFFKNHHYAIDSDAQGNSRIILDARENPTLNSGGETEFHKSARENYESGLRLILAERHRGQSTNLAQRSADTVRKFLLNNSDALASQKIQEELRGLIKTIRLDALGLQQDQESEAQLADQPSVETIRNRVNSRRDELSQMEQKHLDSEIESSDHQILLSHKCSLSLKSLPASPFSKKTGPPRIKFEELLPAYLSKFIIQLGIYQL